MVKTVHKKVHREGHEKGAGHALFGPTGGEGVWAWGWHKQCVGMEHGFFMSRVHHAGADQSSLRACGGEVHVERYSLVLDGEKWGVWGIMC